MTLGYGICRGVRSIGAAARIGAGGRRFSEAMSLWVSSAISPNVKVVKGENGLFRRMHLIPPCPRIGYVDQGGGYR